MDESHSTLVSCYLVIFFAHVIQDRTGRDVITFGRGGAGSLRGLVAEPISQFEYLNASLGYTALGEAVSNVDLSNKELLDIKQCFILPSKYNGELSPIT